jgi:hypothetical protein
MKESHLLGAVCACVMIYSSSASNAALIAYTDQSNFMAALTGTSITLDFDSLATPTIINSGDTIGGITFAYNFSGTDMVVTDGNQFGGGGPYNTTSGSNFLGTDDADIFQDDDDFALSFGAANAIGMYFITAEEPGTSIFDDDIQLTAGSATALLDVDDLQLTLGDGALVFFLGLIDTTGTFNSASITSPNSSGAFLYNIDDITTSAIPLPGAFWLFGTGLVSLFALHRRS